MARILGDIGDPDGRSVGPAMDEDAEDPVSDGEVADRSTLLRRDAGRDEFGQPPLLDHAERTVAGAGDLGGELDDALSTAEGESSDASTRPAWISSSRRSMRPA